jgi:hypothetical protein
LPSATEDRDSQRVAAEAEIHLRATTAPIRQADFLTKPEPPTQGQLGFCEKVQAPVGKQCEALHLSGVTQSLRLVQQPSTPGIASNLH